MERQAFEPTGLVPRSIIRTFDRFRQQLLPETKAAAVQEFRISRYQVLVSVKCLLSLFLLPILVNLLAKTFLLNSVTEYLWNTQQSEIFLNSYQEDRALREMEDFSEKAYFESLLGADLAAAPATPLRVAPASQVVASQAMHAADPRWGLAPAPAGSGVHRSAVQPPNAIEPPMRSNPRNDLLPNGLAGADGPSAGQPHPAYLTGKGLAGRPWPSKGELGAQFQDKAMELALLYNKESMVAITNVLGDFLTFVTIALLVLWMRPQIVILRSFLTESIYSLSDTTKSFLLILVTDLLVGFHSPRGWEIGIEMLLRHFGLPENQDFIFLFVAAFPVFLDTIFKYWIFRYLNKISPSTVATYHNMIE
jgi:hypothetical protein